MSNNEVISTITELQEYTRIMEEAKAAAEALRDKLKAHMGDLELLIAGPYKLTYKTVTTTRIDGKRLTADFPEIAAKYSNATTSRPLRIN